MFMSNEFKTELKKLLEKYNAEIYFDVSELSDTYGLFGERMVVECNNKVVIESKGWYLTSGDIT